MFQLLRLLMETTFYNQFFLCWGVLQQYATVMDYNDTNSANPITSGEPSPDISKLCATKGMNKKESPDEIKDAPLYEHFFKRKMKIFNRPHASMLNGELGVDCFPSSELPYPNMTIRVRISRSRLIFWNISENPSVILGISVVDSSLYTPLFAHKDDHRKEKRMDMRAYFLLEFNVLETQSISLLHPDKTISFKKMILTVLRFVRLFTQRTQTPQELDHTSSIQSGMSNLISDKSEHSEKDRDF